MKLFWPSLLPVPILFLSACAIDAETPVQLHVRDFGARPSSDNIFQALEDAAAAATAMDGPVEILFEPNAVYRIARPNAAAKGVASRFSDQYAWIIRNATNLVVNGQGATLLVTDSEIGGICMENSSHIELRNFTIDYDPLPYTQGAITQVNPEEYWFELKLDAGYPAPDTPSFERAKKASGNWGLTIRDEPSGHRRYGPTAIFSDHWEKTGDRLWRFYPSRDASNFSVLDNPLRSSGLKSGDRYVHMARNWSQAIAGIDCDQILWENIEILAAPGLSFYPRGTSHHTIRDCHVKLKPGRIFSSTSDGIHMRGSRGHVLIEGCSFEGMADDGINVHSSAMSIQSQPAPNQVVVKKHTFSVRPGDELLLVRSASASTLGTTKVAVVEDLGAAWKITMEEELPKLAAGEGFASSDNLYNLSEAANPFTIRNCHFKDYRGRGILVSACGGTIENNLFEMPEGWGVVLLYESTRWAEGPMAYDLVIRNNEFRAVATRHNPAIFFHLITRNGTVEGYPFHDILIEGNRFRNYQTPVVRLEYARDIEISGNWLFNPCDTPDYGSVVQRHCKNIVVEQMEQPEHYWK